MEFTTADGVTFTATATNDGSGVTLVVDRPGEPPVVVRMGYLEAGQVGGAVRQACVMARARRRAIKKSEE